MTVRIRRALRVLPLIATAAGSLSQARSRIDIPEASGPVGQPASVARVNIPVAPGWTVRVFITHSADSLDLEFTHLRHGGAERYPEVLIDPADVGGDGWRAGQWWLHSSYNLCEGNGVNNVYERDHVFQCAKTKVGWRAEHFPLSGDGRMEVRIALRKFSPALRPGHPFGLALDVTDTRTAWSFWPASATLARPATWAKATLVGRR